MFFKMVVKKIVFITKCNEKNYLKRMEKNCLPVPKMVPPHHDGLRKASNPAK